MAWKSAICVQFCRHDVECDQPSPPHQMIANKEANVVADALDARVFVYSGVIDAKGYGRVLQEMQPSEEQPYRPNSVLVLTTRGGLADSAYQIARLLQNTSKTFYLCVPTICKSAGTLLALGANQIIMTDVSELGPLDVQLMRRDELGQRRSGLVVRTALEGLAEETFQVFERVMLGITIGSRRAVSFEVASRIAASISTGVMAPVYGQINPDALGSDLRDLQVATAYGERLSQHCENSHPDTVRTLVEDYPAHEFIIDKAEAERLFKVVAEPSEELSSLMRALGPLVYSEQTPHFVKRLDGNLEAKGNETTKPPGKAEASSPSVDGGRETARNGNRGRKQKTGKAAQEAKRPRD